ncbi:MAG: hypothetical protein J7J85_06500 [Deltaproteobacteria bacterium]|nr:hypothetical protein [Deltaproteobacteria bacterium]
MGTGIISTAIKAGMADKKAIEKSIACMNTLNKKAAEVMKVFEVHACTDVTGFGLLGHACEVIEDSDVGMIMHASDVPFFLKHLNTHPGVLYRVVHTGTSAKRRYQICSGHRRDHR